MRDFKRINAWDHRKSPREKDITSRYLSGNLDEDRVDASQKFSNRNKNAQKDKILRTLLLRAQEPEHIANIDALPVGQVVQVFSLFCEVEYAGLLYLCVIRKTLNQSTDSFVIVGDYVRFLEAGEFDEQGRPTGVIEQSLPRKTLLTRSDSFRGVDQHPIVANADQMLIVAAVLEPAVKWGLIDRMTIAARAGGLNPIICLNKIDLAAEHAEAMSEADEVLKYYESLGLSTLRTSTVDKTGLAELSRSLIGHTTVLAGHSGVGKSTLLNAIDSTLKLRTGAISGYTGKGRHTTSSARRYVLQNAAGSVIDTPGVKLFGLWGVTRANVDDYFPDVKSGAAPEWRIASHQRILESLN